ncbi:MAG TPA: hypothetical protein VLA93_21815 [Pyrinomonadaceae bacterium]|nr:hypothetical protein [Pyrinomonadaceae bacterium]
MRCSPTRFARSILVVLLVSLQFGVHSSIVSSRTQSEEKPVYTNYKGVSIGMTADEVRKKLGEPADKSAAQDFYQFSEDETATVWYDALGTTTSISVTYFKSSDAPTAKNILGVEIEPQLSGSLYKLIKYPKAGYHVSYSRTEGDPTVITVTMTKMEPNKPN